MQNIQLSAHDLGKYFQQSTQFLIVIQSNYQDMDIVFIKSIQNMSMRIISVDINAKMCWYQNILFAIKCNSIC